jgi:hypothetical protein
LSLVSSQVHSLERHIFILHEIHKDRFKKTGFTPDERNTMSELYHMIEQYITIRYALQDKYYQQQTLLTTYRKHENEKLFQSTLKSQPSLYTTEDFAFAAMQGFELWQYEQLKNRFTNADVDKIVHYDDITVITRKLKQIITLGSQASLTSKKIDLGLVAQIEEMVSNKYLEVPIVALYYYVYKLIFHSDQDQWFDKFSQTLTTYEDTLDTDTITSIYFLGINYCIRRFNTGDKSYGEILLRYYLDGLKKNYLLTNGYLSRNTYRNICTIAIRLDKLQDATDISQQYMHLLRVEDKDSAYHFNMANIYYASQDYNTALTSIQMVNFEDHLSNLFAKTLLLKIYYVTNEDRLLDSHLDAMHIYLVRKKILGYHRTNYANIIKYTRKLSRLNPYDHSAKEKLIHQITAEKYLTDRDWLLKQLA